MDFNTKVFFKTVNMKQSLLIDSSVVRIGILRLYFCNWPNHAFFFFNI